MKVLKTIFWTTIFWLVLLLIVFIYAKYTASGESLANSIAKQLWVTPAAEMMTESGSMMMETSMDDIRMLQESVDAVQMNVEKLLDMSMEDMKKDSMMWSWDMMDSDMDDKMMSGEVMDDTISDDDMTDDQKEDTDAAQ